MKAFGKYSVILEEGEAQKAFAELTENEIKNLGERILEKVRNKGKIHGLEPVIGHTDSSRQQNADGPSTR